MILPGINDLGVLVVYHVGKNLHDKPIQCLSNNEIVVILLSAYADETALLSESVAQVCITHDGILPPWVDSLVLMTGHV